MTAAQSFTALSGEAAARVMRGAARASVALATILLGLKFYAFVQSDALSMLGSLLDTGLDLFASLVSLFAITVATRPADADHRFGHGKAEAIGALFQTGVIMVSAASLLWRAILRLMHPEPVGAPELGIGASVVAIGLTLMLVAYQSRVVKRTGSIAIQTDRLHYSSDVALNLAVIVALALETWAGLRGADPLFGAGIALYLAWGAARSARHAIDMLMDKEWSEEDRRRIVVLAQSHPQVAGVHELRTRTSGLDKFIQFHIWLNPQLSVGDAHRIVDETEALVAREYPDADILIHVDPDGLIEQGERDPDHGLLDPTSARSRLRGGPVAID